MTKTFADVEQDLRFQLDLVHLAEALRNPASYQPEAPEQTAGLMEELVRVQKRSRPGNRFNG